MARLSDQVTFLN